MNVRMSRLSSFFPLLLVVLLSLESVVGLCPAGCELNGVCEDGVCKCNPGFAGGDCAFPFQTCPDGIMMCFNGALCDLISIRQQEEGKSRYQCDCSTVPEASPFQISECDEPDAEICQKDVPFSSYAFCTNGGTCVKTVSTGEPHAGCVCPDEFEGRHCQYRKGTAPEAELILAHSQKEHNVEGFLLFLILCISAMVLGGFGYMVYHLKQLRQVITKEQIDNALEDIELDEVDPETENPVGEMA